MSSNNRSAALGLMAAAFLSSACLAQDLGWSRYGDRSSGIAVDLPVGLFSTDRGPTERFSGRTFATPDGRADVSLYSIQNASGDTPSTFLEKNFQLPRSAVVYRKVTGRFVAVSGFREGKIWYARCNFGSGLVNCVALNYPASEKRQWDAVVTRISNSLSAPRPG